VVSEDNSWPTLATFYLTNPSQNAAASALVAAGPTGATCAPAVLCCRRHEQPSSRACFPRKRQPKPSLYWKRSFFEHAGQRILSKVLLGEPVQETKALTQESAARRYTGQTNRNLARFLPLTAGSAADLADCLVDTLQPDWK
jgi:hypothetical protein